MLTEARSLQYFQDSTPLLKHMWNSMVYHRSYQFLNKEQKNGFNIVVRTINIHEQGGTKTKVEYKVNYIIRQSRRCREWQQYNLDTISTTKSV